MNYKEKVVTVVSRIMERNVKDCRPNLTHAMIRIRRVRCPISGCCFLIMAAMCALESSVSLPRHWLRQSILSSLYHLSQPHPPTIGLLLAG